MMIEGAPKNVSAKLLLGMRDKLKRTPLFSACCVGNNAAVAAVLLEYGETYIHSGDGSGMCPLHLAAMQGDVALLETLLPFAGKDDLDATDGQGRTALLLATLEGHAEVVALLLESGADAAVKDSDGSDARSWATDLAHDDIVALLKS